MKFSCIKPWDTNKTLEATFKFIYKNQNLPNGEFLETILYLAPALKEIQSYENYDNRNEAYNIIYGKVIEVKSNYVKLEVVSECDKELQVYTVAYSDIQNLRSGVISKFTNEYISYINKLPMVCECYGNRYYDLLVKLEKAILTLKESELLYLIYSGRFSFGYNQEQYTIVNNLIIVDNNGIVPITTVAGFFIVENKKSNVSNFKEESEENMGEV